MDFELNVEQKMLQKSAREFLRKEVSKDLIMELMSSEKGYSPQIWKKMANLDWMRLPFSEAYDGYGGSFLDLAVILEELGRSALPSPFFSTIVVCGSLLQQFASEAMKRAHITKIASGKHIISLAHLSDRNGCQDGPVDMVAEPHENQYRLSGKSFFVPWGDVADFVVCAAETPSGVTLFMLDARTTEMTFEKLITINGIGHSCNIEIENQLVSPDQIIGEAGKGREQIAQISSAISTGLSCRCVGGMQKTIDMTIEYANGRKQFGKPLAAFQAIQHYFADMVSLAEQSKYAAYYAAWRISERLDCRKDAAIAKAWCGESFKDITKLAHQITGAIGYTEEYDLHLYSKEAKRLEVIWGTGAEHRRIVASEMGLN